MARRTDVATATKARFTVKRNDFKHRARVTLTCACSTLTVRCKIEHADLYEAGLREHACGPLASINLVERPALARMLRHMAGDDA